MSRLWSRYGVRTIAIALLLVGVVGGVYLGQDREVQQQGLDAQLAVQADRAERRVLDEQQAAHAAAIAPQREAEVEAAAKAADAAKAAAVRADKAKVAVSRKQEREKAAGSGSGSSGKLKPYDGPVPASCNEYKGHRRTGCAVLLRKGFKIDQMPCLDRLWKKESGWNPRAANRSSGAYGIPQSLPGTKMASAGSDWKTNPETQIKWGLGYIKGRYGSPCAAWSHSQAKGWY